jgi:hypothetical protein
MYFISNNYCLRALLHKLKNKIEPIGQFEPIHSKMRRRQVVSFYNIVTAAVIILHCDGQKFDGVREIGLIC